MILFVDDNWLALDGFIGRLEQAGKLVQRMSDADRALMWFRENHLSVEGAILGVMMPADGELEEFSFQGLMTGVALAKHLRQLRPELPIVFLTGHHGFAMGEEINRFPGSACVHKEALRLSSFVQQIEQLFAQIAANLKALESSQ